tara:strand:+ start:3559 stop:3759 length:201 start_codon:yes stop_codon:yes gene_type:complete
MSKDFSRHQFRKALAHHGLAQSGDHIIRPGHDGAMPIILHRATGRILRRLTLSRGLDFFSIERSKA